MSRARVSFLPVLISEILFCFFADTVLVGQEKGEPYPLGTALRVLERDLTSKEYAAVLATMIPTDLAAEWKRIGTPDNHEAFLQAHGGKEKVLADPQLKAAYERRLKIAEQFLDLMRVAYKNRNTAPPFDKGEKIDLLTAGKKAETIKSEDSVPVRVVMPAPGSERNWPRLRGPDGQGTAIEPNFPLNFSDTENVAWKVDLPGPGNGSPVIWGNHLFITSASEDGQERWLVCYARDSGKLLWKQTAPKPSSQEKLYWKNTYASSTPVTDGERVIAFFGNSGLVCYDFDGKQLWHRDLGPLTITHGPGTSPALYKDKVIVVQDSNRGTGVCAAFNKFTGEKVWEQTRDKAMCWSSPVVLHVGDHDEVVYNGSYKVIAYNPDTGAPLWWVNGPSIESIPTIVIGGGLIFSISGRNGPMLAIRPGGKGDATETHIQWQLERGGPHVPSPTYYDGRLYIVNDTGVGTCLDATTGATIWQERLRGRFSMSPVEAAGKLLLLNETGTVYVLEAGPEFKVLATNELNDDTLATPAVLGGRIYIRTKTKLLCIAESN